MTAQHDGRCVTDVQSGSLPQARFAACVLACGFVVVGAAVPSRSYAQVPRSSPNAQLLEDYQEAERARDQLQAQNRQLKRQLETIQQQLRSSRAELSAAKSSAGATRNALAAARVQSQGYSTDLDQARANLKTLIGRFGDTIVALRAVESSRDVLRKQLATREAALNTCAERNADLYNVATQVLQRYEHQGLFHYLARYEPFTRLEQTRIDNYVDDYRQRAQELRLSRPVTVESNGPGASPKRSAPSPAARKP
jgi:chromosome segregation ATPase